MSNYFPLYSFKSKFKKTKVLNKPVPDKTYDYFAAFNKDYADFIKEEGFCSYAGGLFSLVDPFDYVGLLTLPGLEVISQNAFDMGHEVPLIRSGFGDIIICDMKLDTRNDFYHSFYNERYNMGSKVGYMFEMQLTDTDFLNDNFKKRLFNQVMKISGSPKADENFGFPMDFPWDRERELEKKENVRVYNTVDYFNQLSKKHA